MKCLEITFIPPDKCSGGGLGVLQSIRSLLAVCDVDYIGPAVDENIFHSSDNKFEVIYILKNEPRSVKDIIVLLGKGISTSFYKSWKKVCSSIEWKHYDFVHVETSRYDFVVRKAKQSGKKTIIRMHNIEKDYGAYIFFYKKNIQNLVRMYSFSRNEKYVMQDANVLVFLTKNDINRAKELYHINDNKIEMVPVCIDREETLVATRNDKSLAMNFLMTGTLSYGPNAEGIGWFVSTVWEKLCNDQIFRDCTLTIAGSNPSRYLVKLASKYKNIKLISSPKDMSMFFMNADLYIAPIFDGAGMKVKVAEALSYGLPIVGTSHAWIGYEHIITGKFLADTEAQFNKVIRDIMTKKIKLPSKYEVLKSFELRLSISHSCNEYRNIVSKTIKMKK